MFPFYQVENNDNFKNKFRYFYNGFYQSFAIRKSERDFYSEPLDAFTTINEITNMLNVTDPTLDTRAIELVAGRNLSEDGLNYFLGKDSSIGFTYGNMTKIPMTE